MRSSSAALRREMNTARRAPRAHGIWGMSFLAASVIDFVKRAFVMVIILCSLLWVSSPVDPKDDGAFRQVLGHSAQFSEKLSGRAMQM